MTAVKRCCNAMWKKKVHVKMADIYHERQVKELCALHALNNLFQNKLYDKSQLDEICENLAPNSWFNPHKSMLGLGNYDVNVILIALQSRGYEGIWFDKRNMFFHYFYFFKSEPYNYAIAVIRKQLDNLPRDTRKEDPQSLNLSNIVGFILNTPSDYKFCIVTIRLHRRHWVAIREIDGQYYNLDSKNDIPQVLGDAQKLIDFLRTELKTNDRELFIVVTQEVEKNQSWLLSPSPSDKSETRT